jgi:hypothetical protein
LKAGDEPLSSGEGQGAEGRPAPCARGERTMITEGEVGERLKQGLGAKPSRRSKARFLRQEAGVR